MKTSLHKKISVLIMIILIFVSVSLLWLTSSSSGLHWTFEKAKTYLPGNLTVESFDGSLLSTINASGIKYQIDENIFKAEKITLLLNLSSLLLASIDIDKLNIQNLHINLATTDNKNTPVTLPDIFIPWRVSLSDVNITNININQNEQSFKLNEIKLNASALLSHINIKALSITNDEFMLNIKGSLKPVKNYTHKLNTNWRVTLPSSIVLTGQGKIKGSVDKTYIQQKIDGPLKASLSAEVNDLTNQISWQATTDVSDINPALFWPDWHGTLQAKLISHGQIKNNQITSDLTIEKLTGTLRDHPVLLQSQLNWNNDTLSIKNLNLKSASAVFNATGHMDSKLKIDWSLSATDLAELHTNAHGQLTAKGKLRGTIELPVIDAIFSGQALSLENNQVDIISGNIHTDIFSWKETTLDVTAQSISYQGYQLDTLNIDANMKQLRATARSNDLDASIKVKGNINDNAWQGKVVEANIISKQHGNWSLKSPALFNLKQDEISLAQVCLIKQNAHVCTDFQNKNESWNTHLNISQLPLKLFSSWLPPDLKLEGVANASAEVNFNAHDKLTAKAKVSLPPGSLSYPLANEKRGNWNYHNGTIDILLDQQGLKASSEIPMQNGDHLKANFSLPGLRSLTPVDNQSLHLDARLHLQDPAFISTLVPEAQDINGQLNLIVSADGTLAQPKLYSEITLQNGSMQIPRLGLSINNINFKSQTDDTQNINFKLTGNSGEGRLELKGKTLLNKELGWPTSITIKGDSFEISQTPEAKATASPDLQITVKHHKIDINGQVHFPYAKLQPRDFTTAAHVSDDAVIIGHDKPVDEKWAIHSKIRLTLGERVNFYGFGFEGRFTGNLLLENEPGQLTKATGEITSPEGRYRAYGQRLDVEHGRLIYTGSPISNPGLDIRAVRNTGEVVAGIKVRGSLNKPEVEIFSVPAMGQTDALSYLLLGHPIDSSTSEEGAMITKAALALSLSTGDYVARILGEEFGIDEMRIENSNDGDQASLIIGRYLSPKLYVSYGIGLIETVNTINLRYQISDNWQLKGESGERQSADLLYIFER